MAGSGATGSGGTGSSGPTHLSEDIGTGGVGLIEDAGTCGWSKVGASFPILAGTDLPPIMISFKHAANKLAQEHASTNLRLQPGLSMLKLAAPTDC